MRLCEVCKLHCSREHSSEREKFYGEELKKCNNALARGASCGRLASFAAPLM